MAEEPVDTQLHLSEFVEAMRTSSDRARYAFYVVVVATVLIFITNHNIHEDSWPRRRLDKWYQYAREPGRWYQSPPKTAGRNGSRIDAIKAAYKRDASDWYDPPEYLGSGDPNRLKAVRAEYTKQFASRAIFTTSPIPGVSIDINDLGLMSGIALVLLLLVLVMTIAREHENLQLSLYKVRRVCAEDKEASQRGDSRANILYHTLAMTQVLNAPPTLARWGRHGVLHYLRLVFLAPALVYSWVFWTEWRTQYIAALYGIDNTRILIFELAMTVTLFALGLAAWAHSSAMARRWEQAFFRINPVRKVFAQAGAVEWLKLFSGFGSLQWLKLVSDRWSTAHVRNKLITDVVDGEVAISMPATAMLEPETVHVEMRHGQVSRRRFRRSVAESMKGAAARADQKCQDELLGQFDQLLRFVVEDARLSSTGCVVRGRWFFEYTANRFPSAAVE